MRALTFTLLGGLVSLSIGCTGEDVAPLPEPVPLRCAESTLFGPEMIAAGGINLRDVGPCGDIVYQSFTAGVSAQTLLSPGLDPVVVVGQPRGFSPAGDMLAINGATGQVYDVASGEAHDLFEGFGDIRFLRDTEDTPNVYAVGCGEQEVRVLDPDGTVRTLATDVVTCPASAAHAPILIYQDQEGHLHRLDVSTGETVSLDEILYSDGSTTFPGSGRNDLLVLSSDGEVVVHHQRAWGGGREWATLTRTSDGQVLGAIPDANRRFDVTGIPGGHVMAINTGLHLWVLSRDYEFFAYEGLINFGTIADRQLVVWDERYHEVFLFEPGTGFRSEAILEVPAPEGGDDVRTPQIIRSPDGRWIVVETTERCDSGQCQQMFLHDVVNGTTSMLFDGVADARIRYLSDAGYAVVEGVFETVPGGVFDRSVQVYGPSGRAVVELQNRNVGRIESRGETLLLQSFDVSFGGNRLDRLDGRTGDLTTIATDVQDLRVARDRVYYLTLDDPMMGTTALFVAPF